MGEAVNSSVFDSNLANISKSQKNKALAALLAVTLVWGATFIWMKQALDALDVAENNLWNQWSSCSISVR